MAKWQPGLTAWNKGKGKGIAWIRANAGHTGDACLEWPYSRDHRGYGNFAYDGGTVQRAHRVMCALAHGEPPTAKHLAAHSCHNRGCCNPRHLSWKTNSGNQLDRRENGTAKTAPYGQGGHVLTPEQRQRVKALAGTTTNTALAAQFGCSRRTIERTLQRT